MALKDWTVARRVCGTMQWRRRHCCTHTTTLFYLLSLLGVLLILAHLVWFPKLTGIQWWKGYPVVYSGGWIRPSNDSGRHSLWRFIIVPQQLPTSDANATSKEKPNRSVETVSETTVAPTRSQSDEDFVRVTIKSGPFKYLINEPDKCTKNLSAPFLVLLVATEAREVEARNAIRETWGNESIAQNLGLIRLFLLGKKDGELGAIQQKTLQSESNRHHDIIQQDFLDSYKNLTIKTLMGMNWVAIHCPQARYVMKTDSDMFVNTHNLIFKLLRPELKPRKKYFTGYYMRGYAPARSKKSKWYMPPALYPGEKYPTFCSGTGYVFSADIAPKIYHVSGSIPLLQLEDVYVGICLAQLQIEPIPPPNGFLFNHWRVPYSVCKYNHLITSHGFHPNEILKLWYHLQTNRGGPCSGMAKDVNKNG